MDEWASDRQGLGKAANGAQAVMGGGSINAVWGPGRGPNSSQGAVWGPGIGPNNLPSNVGTLGNMSRQEVDEAIRTTVGEVVQKTVCQILDSRAQKEKKERERERDRDRERERRDRERERDRDRERERRERERNREKDRESERERERERGRGRERERGGERQKGRTRERNKGAGMRRLRRCPRRIMSATLSPEGVLV